MFALKWRAAFRQTIGDGQSALPFCCSRKMEFLFLAIVMNRGQQAEPALSKRSVAHLSARRRERGKQYYNLFSAASQISASSLAS